MQDHPGSVETGLADAARVAVENGLAGFAWLDRNLVVIEVYGTIAAGLQIGRPASEGVLALFGYDKQIAELRNGPFKRFEIANIARGTPTGTTARMNLHVMWDEATGRYLLILAPAMGQVELERELARKARETQLLKARELEQAAEIRRINAELTRANHDLSEFADIISHDLRAPLRGMRYYAEDLEQAIDQANSTAAKALADRLQIQARRMTRMLGDLLEYARAGRKDEMVACVDTRALVETIVNSLPHPESFSVRISGAWPTIETLAAPLDLVLRNLLDNALKHHDRESGLIEICGTVHNESLEVAISDDGPGIPVRLHETAFLPFRTLGGSGGNGMGLALVRRVVDAVGASILLESDPQKRRGTTFRVRWPLKLPDC